MDAYRAATGCTQTRLDEIVSGYRTFSQSMDRADMRAGTYDKIMSRFSAIWPDDAEWPAGIDRPEPALLDENTLKLVSEAVLLMAKSFAGIHPEWPPISLGRRTFRSPPPQIKRYNPEKSHGKTRKES